MEEHQTAAQLNSLFCGCVCRNHAINELFFSGVLAVAHMTNIALSVQRMQRRRIQKTWSRFDRFERCQVQLT
jgi:hypothetical protein